MNTISLSKYGPIISNKLIGDEIHTIIWGEARKDSAPIEVDLQDIKSTATFNAKQIFGKLYLEMGASSFFQRIKLINATDDLKLIIRIGIQNALEDSQMMAKA